MKEKKKNNVNSDFQHERKSIKQWREDDRPRERLLKFGASSLSDSDLLAIIISSGTKGFSAVDIGRLLLEKFQTLSNLSSKDVSELFSIKGLGKAKSIKLAAIFELSKRIKAEPFDKRKSINSPDEVAKYFIQSMQNETKEKFKVLLLNSVNQIYREVTVTEGLLDRSIVHPREVFRIAISENAASIILIHNHPSGSVQPSNDDLSVTKILVEAGKTIGIKIIDHLIIAGNDYFSFLKAGLI